MTRRIRNCCGTFLIFLSIHSACAQSPIDSVSLPGQTGINKSRVWLVSGFNVALITVSYISLKQAWYKGYSRTSFHFFNDNSEWNQMDKAGHIWTTYQLSRVGSRLWQWTGMDYKQSAWLGAASGMAYQSIIEIQDGFSSEWGFSWGDMAANVVGAAAFVAQELTWKDQRFQVKFSYWPHNYPPDLVARRDDLFGKTTAGRVLKDYNSQTYWLSANPRSLFAPKFPAWLNIAFGYSSDLMLGGKENKWIDEGGNEIDRTDIPRIRRFYLSPDIDFTKIKTRSKFLRSTLFVLNCIKIPAPTLEFSDGGFKFHPVYF